MKNVLVVGASGAAGQQVVRQLLLDSNFQLVHVFVRRSLNLSENPKLIEHVFDPLDFSKLCIEQPINVMFCTLGSTQKQAGSKHNFLNVDYDLVVAAGQWAKDNNVPQFHVISSLGADKNSLSFYPRAKGHMEQALINLKLPTLFIYRPSLLLAPNRNDFRFGELAAALPMQSLNFIPLKFARRYRPVKVAELARGMITRSYSRLKGVVIVESEKIPR